MSAYKRLNNSDVILLPYVANKLWEYNSCSLSGSGVYVFTGKKMSGSFEPSKELKFNGRYERLVYDSINHLYYQEYSGSLLDNHSNLAGTRYSSSTNIRPSASYHDYTKVGYMFKDFPESYGSEIKVISISKDLAGLAVHPGSINISSST